LIVGQGRVAVAQLVGQRGDAALLDVADGDGDLFDDRQ
jgi:hypothetical protein